MEKIKTVIISDLALGTMIFAKQEYGPQPSIYAASSNSLGMPIKNCLYRKINNPERIPIAKRAGNHITNGVSTNLIPEKSPVKTHFIEEIMYAKSKERYCRYEEISVVEGGTTIVKITIENNKFLPLKLNLANP